MKSLYLLILAQNLAHSMTDEHKASLESCNLLDFFFLSHGGWGRPLHILSLWSHSSLTWFYLSSYPDFGGKEWSWYWSVNWRIDTEFLALEKSTLLLLKHSLNQLYKHRRLFPWSPLAMTTEEMSCHWGGCYHLPGCHSLITHAVGESCEQRIILPILLDAH